VFAGHTYVANREQVCQLTGHLMASRRAINSDVIDDYIWKNLSIWAAEKEHLWPLPGQKKQYIKCHEKFASFHCSHMFANCTAEIIDKKPALPCKEICDEMIEECKWAPGHFLPYNVDCKDYPSRSEQNRLSDSVIHLIRNESLCVLRNASSALPEMTHGSNAAALASLVHTWQGLRVSSRLLVYPYYLQL